MFMNTNREKM